MVARVKPTPWVARDITSFKMSSWGTLEKVSQALITGQSQANRGMLDAMDPINTSASTADSSETVVTPITSVTDDGGVPISETPLPPNPTAGQQVRFFIWKYLGTLVMERTAHEGTYVMSLGRAALVVVLIGGMTIWMGKQVDIPASMERTLGFLLAFVFGSRGLTLAEAVVHARTQKGAANVG